MFEFLTRLDLFSLGAIIGALLLFAGLVWVLVEDSPLDNADRNRSERNAGGKGSVEDSHRPPRRGAA